MFIALLVKYARSVVGATILRRALYLVRQVSLTVLDNADRRTWVIKQLQETGVSENIARLLVELAVYLLKTERAN